MNEKVTNFTEFLLTSQALQFGDFTLKSGRQSPYFINAGAFNSGQKISHLGDFYAQTIIEAQQEGVLPEHIDTVFGPAYKGIPLAVSVSSALWNSYHKDIGYTFDRKEAKDHGDKGIFVGTQLADGMNVLLIDDVMTAGTAVRHVVPQLLAAANITIVGMILSVDRMEKTANSQVSAIKSVEEEFGFPIIPIANVEQIFSAAREIKTAQGDAYMDDAMYAQAQKYLATYGVQ